MMREDKLFGYADGTCRLRQLANRKSTGSTSTQDIGRRAAGQPADRGAEGRRTAWFFRERVGGAVGGRDWVAGVTLRAKARARLVPAEGAEHLLAAQ